MMVDAILAMIPARLAMVLEMMNAQAAITAPSSSAENANFLPLLATIPAWNVTDPLRIIVPNVVMITISLMANATTRIVSIGITDSMRRTQALVPLDVMTIVSVTAPEDAPQTNTALSA